MDGEIWDSRNNKVGKVFSDGEVWDSRNNKVGKVFSDGEVWNSRNNKVGKAFDSPLILAGGAALLLLLRPTG